jgi:hypothetical protein
VHAWSRPMAIASLWQMTAVGRSFRASIARPAW